MMTVAQRRAILSYADGGGARDAMLSGQRANGASTGQRIGLLDVLRFGRT